MSLDVTNGPVQASFMGRALALEEKAKEAEKLAALASQPWVRVSLEKLAKDYRVLAALETIRSRSEAR